MKTKLSKILMSLVLASLAISCKPNVENKPNPNGPNTTSRADDEDIIHTVTKIDVSGTYRTSYLEGEKFDTTGMLVKATWEDGVVTEVNDTQYTVTPDRPLKGSDTKVSISFGDAAPVDIKISVSTNGGISPKEGTSARTNYFAGEVFDPTGLELQLSGGGVLKDIDMSKVVFDKTPIKDDATTTKIKYESWEYDYPIHVITEKEIDHLEINRKAVKSIYKLNETFDFSGMIVNAILKSGETLVIPNSILNASPNVLTKVGNQEISINYKGLSPLSYKVDVVTDLINIEIEPHNDNKGNKSAITKKGKLTGPDQKPQAEDSRITTKKAQNPNHWMLQYASNGDFVCDVSRGDQITLNFNSAFSGAGDLVIRGASNRDIQKNPPVEVKDLPLKDAMKIKVNGKEKPISENAKFVGKKTSNPAGDKWLWVDWQEVNVGSIDVQKGTNTIIFDFINPNNYRQMYGEGIGQYDNVQILMREDKNVTKVEKTKDPVKMDYKEGDAFDPTGMEITATYDDGSTKVFTPSELEIEAPNKLSPINNTIKVTCEGQVITFKVNVEKSQEKQLKEIQVTKNPDKMNYLVGEKSFDSSGMEVTGIYSDGSREIIPNDSLKIENPSSFTKETNKITISYENLTTTLTVNVLEEGKVFLSKEGNKVSRAEAESSQLITNPNKDQTFKDMNGVDKPRNMEMNKIKPKFTSPSVATDLGNDASNKNYVCDIYNGDKIIFSSFELSEDKSVVLRIRGSSTRFGAWNEGKGKVLEDTQLNQIADITIDGQPIAISDSKKFEGRTLPNSASSSTSDSNYRKQLVWWNEIDLDAMNLKAGTHVIELTAKNPNNYANCFGPAIGQYDYISVLF